MHFFPVCRGTWESWKAGCLEIQWNLTKKHFLTWKKQIATQHLSVEHAYISKWGLERDSYVSLWIFNLSSAGDIRKIILNRWPMSTLNGDYILKTQNSRSGTCIVNNIFQWKTLSNACSKVNVGSLDYVLRFLWVISQ